MHSKMLYFDNSLHRANKRILLKIHHCTIHYEPCNVPTWSFQVKCHLSLHSLFNLWKYQSLRSSLICYLQRKTQMSAIHLMTKQTSWNVSNKFKTLILTVSLYFGSTNNLEIFTFFKNISVPIAFLFRQSFAQLKHLLCPIRLLSKEKI